MPRPALCLGIILVTALGAALALEPADEPQTHRHGFAGKQTALLRGSANIRVEEKQHDISRQSFKSQPSSEHIQLTAEAATGSAGYIDYDYETPPAPVSAALTASVWVKATRPGTQLRARVVLPKEPDPAHPEAPLAMFIVGGQYERKRPWERLILEDVPALIGKRLPALQAKLGRTINTADAYIDRLVLNVYSGPGTVDVWVDDLEIGPVKPRPAAGGAPGVPAKNARNDLPTPRSRTVIQRNGELRVDSQPFFFRAIRYTGTPLYVLREAGFNALWLPSDAAPAVVEESTREGWFVIPSAPRHEFAGSGTALTSLDGFRQKFAASDVLFWDLGGGVTFEEQKRIATLASEMRGSQKPVGADIWDGFRSYSNDLDMLCVHRWPLFTSLEFARYRDWLKERRALAADGRYPVFWTWVQNHLPEWYVASMAKPADKGFIEPIGPHPEQVRQLAYISIASGARGLGFWSDRYLADSYQGRDRLQGMALLNAELELISPVLMSAAGLGGSDNTTWLTTSHPLVKAAMIVGGKGTLLLPMWIGAGDQYVPPQGAVSGLKIIVPGMAEGFEPWLITPAGPERLPHISRGPTGLELTIDEFDLVAPIVFTDNLKLVAGWQDDGRRFGRLAAQWAIDLTKFEYEKIRVVHEKLVSQGVPIRDLTPLFAEANRYYTEAVKHSANERYLNAYRDATRALRPLRVIMRDHWRLATQGLDTPTASPYAVSFYSLPQHWELAREVAASAPGTTVLPYGNFELSSAIPAEGVPIGRLPGWNARAGSLDFDRTVVAAGVVSSANLADPPAPQPYLKEPKSLFSASRPIPPPNGGYMPPAPKLDDGVLKLEVRTQVQRTPDGKIKPSNSILERTFLSVESPAVSLPPGTLVRISAWVKVPKRILGDSAGGVLFYDDVGGVPLAVRLLETIDHDLAERLQKVGNKKGAELIGGSGRWKPFHLYRRVPASGKISVKMAMTGTGIAYFDDVRIEPLLPASASGKPAVIPAGYPRR